MAHQLLDVAKGVKYLHDCDVIYGDLKRVNVSSLLNFMVSLINARSQILWWILPAAHA